MERREGIDRPNEQAFAAFAERASDGPVYMLNLLEFQPEGGAERYGEYGEAVAPLFAQAGGQAFLDMVSSPEYQEIEHLRSEALVRSELRAMDAVDAAELPGG